MATHRIFSDEDAPPQVEAGEMMRRHQLGQQLYFDKDGNAVLSRDDGAKVKLKAGGDAVHTAKPGGIAYYGGDPDDGGSFDWILAASGPSDTAKAKKA